MKWIIFGAIICAMAQLQARSETIKKDEVYPAQVFYDKDGDLFLECRGHIYQIIHMIHDERCLHYD